MKFHVLLTYDNPLIPQTEMLLESQSYDDVVDFMSPFIGDPQAVRMRILDKNIPDNIPSEVCVVRDENVF